MNSKTKTLMSEIGFSGESGECTTTESMNEDQHYMEHAQELEKCVREEAQLWLDNHGTKLFQLEASKFLAIQNRKPKYNVGRPSNK